MKAIIIALAAATAVSAAAPALARDQVVVRDNGWAPQIIVRHGHHGYWDEHRRWREARFMSNHGHRGYWDYHHNWHDWNG
jgi:hypothetical protein